MTTCSISAASRIGSGSARCRLGLCVRYSSPVCPPAFRYQYRSAGSCTIRRTPGRVRMASRPITQPTNTRQTASPIVRRMSTSVAAATKPKTLGSARGRGGGVWAFPRTRSGQAGEKTENASELNMIDTITVVDESGTFLLPTPQRAADSPLSTQTRRSARARRCRRTPSIRSDLGASVMSEPR